MEGDIFTRRERKIIDARRTRSLQVRFDALVTMGTIGGEGKLLVRMPGDLSELAVANGTG